MPETELYVVLSTSHLRPETCENLDSTGLIYDEADARIRVRLPQDADPGEVINLTEDMKACADYVRQASPSSDGIMFDRDGPIEADLATYEWL